MREKRLFLSSRRPARTRALPVLLALGLSLGGCSAVTPSPQADPARTTEPGASDAVQAVPEAAWTPSPEARLAYNFLLLEDLKRSPDAEGADEAVRELLEASPTPQTYLETASFHWSRNNLARAREILKEALEKYPDSWQFYYFLATTYLSEKRFQDAAVTLQDYLARHPRDWRAREELAPILLEAKLHAQALDVLLAVPEAERTPTMLLYIGQARGQLGLKRQAIEALEAAIAKSPEFVEAMAELAYRYEVDKDYVKAAQTYERILSLGESKEEVILRLVKLNLKLNEPAKAMRIAQQGPRSAAYVLEAAGAFIGEGFYEQGRQLLEPYAKRGSPADVFFYLAVISYEEEKNAQQALDYLDRIPEDHPHYERSLNFRAHLLYYLGRKDEALTLITKAKETLKGQKDLWILESVIHEDASQYDQGLAVLDQADKLWPKDAELLYRRGVILERQERRDEAQAVMEQVLLIDPDHAEALNFVGYVLADAGQDLPRAMALVKAALKQRPDSGYIIDSLAWVYYRLGQLGRAWQEINRAVLLLPKDPTAWEHYGDIAKAVGRKKEAARGYRKALENGSENKPDIESKLKTL